MCTDCSLAHTYRTFHFSSQYWSAMHNPRAGCIPCTDQEHIEVLKGEFQGKKVEACKYVFFVWCVVSSKPLSILMNASIFKGLFCSWIVCLVTHFLKQSSFQILHFEPTLHFVLSLLQVSTYSTRMVTTRCTWRRLTLRRWTPQDSPSRRLKSKVGE